MINTQRFGSGGGTGSSSHKQNKNKLFRDTESDEGFGSGCLWEEELSSSLVESIHSVKLKD